MKHKKATHKNSSLNLKKKKGKKNTKRTEYRKIVFETREEISQDEHFFFNRKT